MTLVEYGDFECSYCGQAERVIRELLESHGDDVRYVWRHLPLNDVHPSAQLASEAAEAAALFRQQYPDGPAGACEQLWLSRSRSATYRAQILPVFDTIRSLGVGT